MNPFPEVVMRSMFLSVVLAGCVVGDHQTTPADTLEGESTEVFSRFVPESSIMDPGLGVLADPTLEVTTIPRMWASMGDRICAVEGRHGEIEEDIYIDEEEDEVVAIDVDGAGFVMVEGGVVRTLDPHGVPVATQNPGGDVARGARLNDGSLLLLVDTGEACELVAGGERLAIDASACNENTDIEQLDDLALISTANGILAYRNGALEAFGPGDQVSIDPVSGAIWTLTTGSSVVDRQIGNSTISIDLGGAVVDLAARAGHVVALTDGPELVRLDAASGDELERQAYVGRMDRERLMLGANGHSMVLTGAGQVQFYRLRTDAQMGL